MAGRLLCLLLAFALCAPAPAQIYSTPSTDTAPGVIGLSVDPVPYRCGRYTCLKITGLDRTNFTALDIGDYIVMVNEVPFGSADEFFAMIRRHSPGTRVTIDYWDASSGNAAMYQTASLRRGDGYSMVSLMRDLETILRADARYWEVSTYHENSLRGVRLSSLGGDNYVASGLYTYDGAMTRGNVDTIDFYFVPNGLSCIKYGDESRCRPLRERNPQVLRTVAIVAAGIVVLAAAGSGSGRTSPAPQSQGNYGQSRAQCERSCAQIGDSDPAVEAAAIASCRRRC